jgi:glycosyltransferase, MGT family
MQSAMRGKRVVFFSTPAYGHLQAVYPVLARLVRAGVRVDWYCTEAYRELVTKTGAHFHPYCVDFSRYPLDRLTADFFSLYRGLLVLNRRCYLRYRREIRENPPDLLLYDSMCSFGKNLAKQFGLPSVCLCTTLAYNLPTLIFSNLFWPSLKLTVKHALELLRLTLKEQCFRRREGLPGFSPLDLFVNRGDKTLVFSPPEFQPFAQSFPPSFDFVGTTIRDRIEADSSIENCDIYLSLGSIFAARTGELERILETPLFRGKKVIVSAGYAAADLQKRLGRERLSFVRRTNQLALLPKTGLFVNHGGLNSVYESLYFGVFQICIPQQEEQRLTARLVEKKKLGLCCPRPRGWSEAELRRAELKCRPRIERYRHILRSYDGTARALRCIQELLR